MSDRADSVLLIGFGGPTRPAEIRPFLATVVRGRNVPPERIEEAAGSSPVAWPADVPLIFTAHSIPIRMAEGCRYREEIAESAAAVAGHLGAPQWSIAYQSASGGHPAEGRVGPVPWLEPDVNDVIRELAAGGAREAVLVPVGFLSDHVEVLYD